MAAVDEFDLDGAAPTGVDPGPDARLPRRRSRDRAGPWVAMAVAVAVLGVVTAPPLLPRTMTPAPPWGLVSAGFVIAGIGESQGQIVAQAPRGIRYIEQVPGVGEVWWVVRSDDDSTLVVNTDGRLADVRDEMVALLDDQGPSIHADWVCELYSGRNAWCATIEIDATMVLVDLDDGTVVPVN